MTGPDRDVRELADEFVLGLLDVEEHAAVEAALEQDAATRAAVAAARERFHELDLTGAPAAPSPDLWARIEAAMDAGAPAGAAATGAAASPTYRFDSGRRARPDNDNAIGRWRLAAFAGMAASLLLAAGLAWTLLQAPTGQPAVVAVLADEAGTPLVVVEDYGDASARITPLTEFDVPDDRTMQVWTLPNEELGPVSLGLLPNSGTTVLEGPDLPAPRDDQLYEITIEQQGGSPTGRPTGPILVKGFAREAR